MINNNNRETIYELTIKNKTYIGKALCHPDDIYSKRVGERIAYNRAVIAYLQDVRDMTVEQIKALKHLKSIYDQNDKVDKNGYEYKALLRQIKVFQESLEDLRLTIKNLKEGYIAYVKERAKILSREKAKADSNGL